MAHRFALPPDRAAALHDALRLGLTAVCEPPRIDRIASAQDVYLRFVALSFSTKESFHVLALDSRNRVLRSDMVATGSRNVCFLEPRDVFTPVIRAAATKAIVVHNHPSGDPTPSREDAALTARLAQAAQLLGIELLDHVIVGRGRFESLLDLGLIPPPEPARTEPAGAGPPGPASANAGRKGG